MRKNTIFYYEFKRLIGSRTYLLLLAITLAYCVSLLRSTVIFGTMYTAPFSQWTFCDFVSSLSPLLFVLLLALCARQFSPSECGAAAIISATPMPAPTYKAIRYAAVACAFLIAAVLSIVICFGFYWLVFDYTAFGALMGSAVLLLVPTALLLFGGAMLLGRKNAALIYVLLAGVLIAGIFKLTLPAGLDLLGSSVTLPLYEGNRVFSFTDAYLFGRIVFLAAGIVLTGISMARKMENEKTLKAFLNL